MNEELTKALRGLIQPSERHTSLSEMKAHVIPPSEQISEFIPSGINVVHEMPKVEGHYGLNFYVPVTNEGVRASVHDMRRFLHYVFDEETFIYRNLRERWSEVWTSLWPTASVRRLLDVEMNQCAELGYNFIRYVPGRGYMLWGQDLAHSPSHFRIHEVLAVHKVVHALQEATRQSDFRIHGIHLLAHFAARKMNDLTASREVYKGELKADAADQFQLVFESVPYKPPQVFDLRYDGANVYLIAKEQTAKEMIHALLTLNPYEFQPLSHVKDQRVALYNGRAARPIILLDEALA